MSDNKFIQRLKGKQTPKSVVEVQNDKLIAPFTGVPYSTDVVGAIVDDKDSSVVVAKGAQNWKLDGSSLVTASSLTGDGADYTSEFNASGSGLWINATYSLPDTIFNAGTKWVLKLCGKNLLTTSGGTIGFTLVVKVGNTHITSKAFTVAEGANVFCRQLSIDFSESEQSIIKAQSGDKLTLQLLCSDTNASATIYNGMTVFTALQRRVDGDAVASDKKTFDEVVQDIDDINNGIDKINKDIDDLEKYVDDTFVKKAGDTMTGALNIENIASSNTALLTLTHSNTATYKWNIAPRYNSTTLSVYPGSTETNGYRFVSTGFCPASNNARYLGAASLKWKGVYTGVLNNGADLVVPNKAGTLATMGDVELAARSGTQLTDQGVWYAKMYAATVPPAAEDGTNYADFSQTDAKGNPIIVTYNRVNGAWVQDQTITPPAEYDGYVIVTSKIWDIAEQTGQQGGRILWNHQSKEFTPYPQIISFKDINMTGNSTVDMPQNPGANQIVNKDYVDEAIAAIPTPTVDVTQSIDAEIVGSPTINNDSAVGNLSSQNYLALPGQFDMTGANDFQIVMAFTTADVGSRPQQVIFCENHGPAPKVRIQVSQSKLHLYIYNEETQTAQTLTGSTTLSSRTKYYVMVTYNGSDYVLSLSTDGITYNQEATAVAQFVPGYSNYGYIIGTYSPYAPTVFEVYLDGCYIKKNGVIIWQGMDAPGLHQRVVKGHEVIAFQAPTAGNNYTWYRKYADGWVEQGGQHTLTANVYNTVNLVVTMSDTNYFVSATYKDVAASDSSVRGINTANYTTTSFQTKVGVNGANYVVVWEVKGMAQG